MQVAQCWGTISVGPVPFRCLARPCFLPPGVARGQRDHRQASKRWLHEGGQECECKGQYQQQHCTITIQLSPLSPTPALHTSVQMFSELTSPTAFSTSPPHVAPMLVFFLSLQQKQDPAKIQGELAQSLAAPSPLLFPKNRGLPSKNFLDLVFDLRLAINKTEIREAKCWAKLRQSKADAQIFSSFFGLLNDILMPPPNLPPNACQYRSGKTTQKSWYSYNWVSLRFCVEPSSHLHCSLKKMASKTLPYSLFSKILTFPSKHQPCYFRLVPESP